MKARGAGFLSRTESVRAEEQRARAAKARRGTGISWTDETWNPTVGCSRVSPGCVNCYAEHAAAMVNRTQGERSVYRTVLKVINGDPRWNGVVELVAERLDQPLLWKRPRRIFVNSMSDLFHEELTNEQIAAVFGAMACAPWHTFQVLTKRAKRMREWFTWVERAARECNDGRGMTPAQFCFCHAQKTYADACGAEPGTYPLASTNAVSNGLHAAWPLPNVWLGVSVENQDAADERIPELLGTPSAIRFLSCEPLLDEVQLEEIRSFAGTLEKVLDPECWGDCKCDAVWGFDPGCRRHGGDGRLTRRIDWVIAGVESGAGARPCEVDWLRLLRDQCVAAGVAFFLKQAVGTKPVHRGGGQVVQDVRAGDGSKQKPGGVVELPYLDGVQYAAFPEVARVE